MSKNDTNFRLANRVTLNIAVIYLPTYFQADDMGNLSAAKDLLEKHNIGLQVWPLGGGKSSTNSLPLSVYENPIPDTHDAYQQLRRDVNQLIQQRATGYPFVQPVIFCQYVHPGHGVTPPGTKIGAPPAACLVSPNPQKDKMTVLHELGHAAGLDHQKDKADAKNVMFETDGRENLYRFQVEAFSKAFFARSG